MKSLQDTTITFFRDYFYVSVNLDCTLIGPVDPTELSGFGRIDTNHYVFRNMLGPSFYLLDHVKTQLQSLFPNCIIRRDCIIITEADFVMIKLGCV